MSPRRAAMPVAAMLLLLGGCADTQRWEHPSTPRDMWSTDLASCQSYAQRLMRRELRHEDAFGDQNTTSLDQRMSEFRTKRQEQDIVERCMRQQGYRPAEPEGKDA